MDKFLAMLAYLMRYDYAFNRTQRDMVLDEILDGLDQELPTDNDGNVTVAAFVNWSYALKQERDKALELWRREYRSERDQRENPFPAWRRKARKPIAKAG